MLLITNHFNESYAVKCKKLASYLQILKIFSFEFETIILNQVPMEDNAEADALANLGSSLRIPLNTRIPIIYVMIPKIEDPAKS